MRDSEGSQERTQNMVTSCHTRNRGRSKLRASWLCPLVFVGVGGIALASSASQESSSSYVKELIQRLRTAEEEEFEDAAAELCDLFEDAIEGDLDRDGLDEAAAKQARVDRAYVAFLIAQCFASYEDGTLPQEMTRLEALDMAVETCRSADMTNLEAVLLAECVEVHTKDRSFDKAIDSFDQAIEAVHAYEPLRPYLYTQRVALARQVQDIEGALLWSQRLLALSDLEPSQHCFVHGEVGSLYAELGLLDLAAIQWDIEWETARQVKTTHRSISTVIMASHLHRATLLLFLDDHLGCARVCQVALNNKDLLESAPQTEPKLRLLMAYSQFRLRKEGGDEGDPVATIRLGLSYPQVTQIDRVRLSAWLSLFLCDAGKWADAQTILEDIRFLAGDGALEPPLAFFAATLEAAVALECSEDAQDKSRAINAADNAFDALCDSLSKTPLRAAGVGHFEQPLKRVPLSLYLDVLLKGLPDHLGPRRALDAIGKSHSLSTLARLLDLSSYDVDALQKSMSNPEGSFEGSEGPAPGIFVFHQTPDVLLAFGVDEQEVVFERLPGSNAMSDRIGDWVEILMDASDEELSSFYEKGMLLARDLFPDSLANALRDWSAFTIVGGEDLDWLPFECLPYGASFIGLQKAVNYVPSIPLAIHLAGRNAPVDRRDEKVGETSTLLATVSEFSKTHETTWHVRDLPWSDAIEDRLTAPFQKTSWLRNEEVTIESLHHHLLSEPRLLHIITHGVFDGSRERPAGLIMGDDAEVLWCSDVERLWNRGTQPPLTVSLTACSSAQGPTRLGDAGIAHLGGSFLAQGVKSLTMSPFDLDYLSSVELMGIYQEELGGGASPAEAMRRARLGVSELEGFSHPYFHSLVRVYGAGHKPVFDPKYSGHARWHFSSGTTIGLGSLALLILFAGARLAYRRTHSRNY